MVHSCIITPGRPAVGGGCFQQPRRELALAAAVQSRIAAGGVRGQWLPRSCLESAILPDEFFSRGRVVLLRDLELQHARACMGMHVFENRSCERRT